jgi:3-carboxy-cis,cis-muconate cycloisomerase
LTTESAGISSASGERDPATIVHRHDTFTTPEMTAIFSAETRVQRMLDFEAALARAEARAGVIPAESADAIVSRCKVRLFDISKLEEEAAASAAHSIPLVRMLTELVDERARGFVHWGATSQDVVDTALMLQARDAVHVLVEQLSAVGTACLSLAERHRRTPMAGRTLLQHAVPITFGLKAAHWLALTTRQIRRLKELRDVVIVVQFGGAVGTLAALGDAGMEVAENLAEELGLPLPDMPWHTDRDRVAELVACAGIVSGSMAKIATDVALLMQTEVGEVAEGSAGAGGGSSTMPQKRNPVDAIMAVAAARLALGTVPVVFNAMVQEHERSVGGWQSEWVAVPDALSFTSGAVERVQSLLASIEVDTERMRANLELTGGQIAAEALMMALAPRMGRHEAYHVVAAACARADEEKSDLRAVVAQDDKVQSVLTPQDLERVFDPLSYLGSADAFISSAVAGFREVVEPSPETA